MGKILHELKEHTPFTFIGAITGILLFFVFRNLEHETIHNIFYILHPAHVFLSAIVTASIYKLNAKKFNLIHFILIGYFGSIGIATLSDSLIPYIGEYLLGFRPEVHIGFIEEFLKVNIAAILGIAFSYFYTKTKLPHFGHVLISTWASLFHVLMAIASPISGLMYFVIFIFLFLSVWLPCCLSDIIFPMLFVRHD